MTVPGPTILIVDDEFSLVETLSEILSWEGYAIVTAPNGKVALERMAQAAPQLVLLDLMMPVMDGLAMLDVLRQDACHAQLPVILMSAAAALPRSDEQRYTAFLRKPFEAAVLLRLVRQVLSPGARPT